MKSGDYNLRKGRKVKVFSANREHYMGVWEFDKAVYVGYYFSYDYPKGFRSYTPLFRQGKKRIHGYACWWIPVNEAKKHEKEKA